MGEGQVTAPLHRRVLVRDLAALFVLGLGLRLVWAVLTPPWMAPDEQAHFQYVAHLVEMKSIPHEPPYERTPPPPNYSRELVDSFFITPFDDIHMRTYRGGRFRAKRQFMAVHYDYGRTRSFQRPPRYRQSKPAASATSYPPFYYWFVGLGYRAFYESPLLARIYAVRACSGFLGAWIGVFGYLFAYELRRERWLARAVGLSVALLPMHSFINAAVNNDVGVGLFAAALSWLLARFLVRESFSLRVSLGIGLSAGLMMMMKPSAVGLLGVVALIFLIRGYGAFCEGRLSLWLQAGLVCCLSFIASYGAWILYRTTSPTLSGKGRYSQEGELVSSVFAGSYSLLDYVRFQAEFGIGNLYRVFVTTFWGHFGWREAPMPSLVYAMVIAVYTLSLLGFMSRTREPLQTRRDWLLPLLLVLAQVAFIFLIADYALRFRATGKSLGLVGRYLFPTIVPMFYLLWLGVDRFARGHKGWRHVLLAAMVIVQCVGLTTTIARWYGITFG